MPAKPKPTDAERFATLAEGIADVDDKIANLQAVRATLVTEALRIHPEDGSHLAGEHTVKVSRTRRINAAAVADKYPHEQRPELYATEPRIDVKKVRHHIAPADLDPFLDVSAASVTVT